MGSLALMFLQGLLQVPVFALSPRSGALEEEEESAVAKRRPWFQRKVRVVFLGHDVCESLIQNCCK